MAKKLLHHYRFTPSTNTIVIDGIFARERFLLITNAQSEQQIYVFNDSYNGFASVSFDYPNEKTTVVLDYDCSGMASTDKLQVFVEQDYQTIEPSATFTDPVSKLRVSQPENLIDTDFEYGLQSTKWETLELTKNIPTFYSRDGDQPIPLTSMQSTEESSIITVVTAEPHGLQRGSPIIIIGSASSTTDGGFLVASATNTTTFTYRSKAIQSAPATVLDTYTQLYSGSIYSGTEFKLQDLVGITTDSADPSVLTVNTVYPTNFTNGTSMALANTTARASITFDTDEVITANATTVDISRTAATPAPDTVGGFALGSIQPFSFAPEGARGAEPFYFTEGTTTIDTVADTVTFTEPHGFQNLEAVTYVVDTTANTQIGGLGQAYTYWVVKIDDYTLAFHTILSASTFYRVQLTSNGVSAGLLRSCLVPNVGAGVTNTSGTDDYIQFNLSASSYPYSPQAQHRVLFSRSAGSSVPGLAYTPDPYQWYSTGYDFYLIPFASALYARVASFASGGFLQLQTTSADYGIINISDEPADAGSFYLPAHGLETGDIVSMTATTGSLPSGASSGIPYKIVKVSNDRISLQTTNGSTLRLFSAGSADLVYRVQGANANLSADRIVIPNLTLSDGDAVVYDANGGTEIGGLTNGDTYYIAYSDNNSASLATSIDPAVRSIYVLTYSSTYTNLSSSVIQNFTHGFSTGDRIKYTTTGTSVAPLLSGGLYFVRAITTTAFALYYSAADATADTNRIALAATNNTGSTFTQVTIVDLTSAPVGDVQKLTANFVGAADGVYSVTSTAADQRSFTLAAPEQILPKLLSRTCQQCFDSAQNGFFIQDHGVVTGDEITYTSATPNNVTGITSGDTYYGIQINQNLFRLAATQTDALAGTAITLGATTVTVDQTGLLTFVGGATIVGSIAGQGSVSYAADGTTLTGTGTTFTSYFNKGDTIKIGDANAVGPREVTAYSTADYIQLAGGSTGITTGDLVRFSTDDGQASPSNVNYNTNYYARIYDALRIQLFYTAAGAIAGSGVIQLNSSDIVGTFVTVYPDNPAALVERVVGYVNSDTQLEVTEAFPAIAATGGNYFLNTGLLLRSDGFALHRPYDGGVELIPSTNPDSAMIRQTRKYFRYQSGKGIQVSYAVNFSPTAGIETYTRDATVDGITTATITSRFPHRLTAGLNIVISGSTNTSSDSIGLKNYKVTVGSFSGQYQFVVGGESLATVTLYEGRTYRFDQSDASNVSHRLLFSLTEDGDNNGGTEYTTGVTTVGTPGSTGAYTEIVVASGVATLYTYASGTPDYGFTAPTDVDPNNNQANLWNGTVQVTAIINDLTFRVQLLGQPSDVASQGLVEYYVQNWSNSALRCGLMDDQNGLYFEYDGQEISVCRRSSTAQVSGYAAMEFRSGEITGTSTAWQSQLSVEDNIVIRGQTYVVVRIDSDTLMYISPGYRGSSSNRVIITKTEVTRVPQSQWNIDVCDGTGPSGFYLNINRIQMAYMDYSWYGAGKARFGFKDQYGEVRYVHELTHNNRETEAFMRSGNLPARYEIQNLGAPSYVPALAHWGTSVIMDGRFDDDKAYTFNANSNNITQTGSAALTATGKIDYLGFYTQRYANRYNASIGYALLLDAPDANLAAITKGVAVTGAGLAANTTAALPDSSVVTPYQPYLPSVLTREGSDPTTQEVRDLLVLDRAPTAIAGTSSTYSFAIGGAGTVDVTTAVPLISVRLAPSVDTGTPGFLGERDIINRMQLILQQVGILTTHAAEIQLVLNGQLSTNAWQRVTSPSLSQLLVHSSSDTVTGGANIFQFRVQGGTGATGRTQVLTTQQLGEVATLGNSIMGGDNTFPDGPDVLTVVAVLTEDPSSVSVTNPYIVSGRISWTESQA